MNRKTPEIRGTSVLIAGYGREGKSSKRWLETYDPHLSVSVADKSAGGDAYLDDIGRYETLIRSPGVSPFLPELSSYTQKGGFVTSATNIFFSLVPGITVGVTGTKGKSTTASLIAHILASVYPDVRLAGNIGSPMLDALAGATEKTVFVLELSSHQLADLKYSPHVAVMLNIVPEHLDYYPDFSAYVSAKSRICAYQNDRDYLVYNPAHTILREAAAVSRARHVHYGGEAEDAAAYVSDGKIIVQDAGSDIPVMPVADIPLLGNTENILAAVSTARLLGASARAIASAIRRFKSLPHRLELIGSFRDIRFYNDSLSTIPQATVHALESLGDNVATLIAGGYDRHLDYSELGAYLRAHPVSTLILFPDTGERIRLAIGDVGKTGSPMIRTFAVHTMEEAVRLAYDHTPAGKICLLSPASASYNMFKNYEDRGNRFAELVKNLA